MNSTMAVSLVLVCGLVLANLPFLNQRLFFLGPKPYLEKPMWMRLAELILFYFVVGGIGLFLEQSMGQIYPQKWEFYAITAAMFLTLAFPGFVFRYLLKR